MNISRLTHGTFVLALAYLAFSIMIMNADGAIANTAHHPVNLMLKTTACTNGFTSARSKPQLFQNVLELTTGQHYKINVNKWNALKSSGLFANLSAKSFMKDSGVGINITGVELNTRLISPEITVASARDKRPEIYGGVTNSCNCSSIMSTKCGTASCRSLVRTGISAGLGRLWR